MSQAHPDLLPSEDSLETGPAYPLECRNLSLHYDGLTAVQDVSLRIPKHQITTLIGPSGCGKSSFLQALNRLTDLIPNCRVEGEILLDGQSIRDIEDLTTLRRRIGYIAQKPAPFPFSIRRNLEFPLREHGVRDAAELEEKITEALQQVGLWDEVKDRLPESALRLSGGQQQRLCMARSLALKPEILLLDEPCSALDPLSSAKVEELIHSLKANYTLVMVTHNLPQAIRIGDQMALFWLREKESTLVEAGPKEAFLNHPKHSLTKAYISGSKG